MSEPKKLTAEERVRAAKPGQGTSVGELAGGMGGPAFYRFMRQEDGDAR